jgi:hypothetical protein
MALRGADAAFHAPKLRSAAMQWSRSKFPERNDQKTNTMSMTDKMTNKENLP